MDIRSGRHLFKKAAWVVWFAACGTGEATPGAGGTDDAASADGVEEILSLDLGDPETEDEPADVGLNEVQDAEDIAATEEIEPSPDLPVAPDVPADAGCSSPADCPAPATCQAVSCEDGTCVESLIPGCCVAPEECDDSDLCTTDDCQDLACVHVDTPGCCTAKNDCPAAISPCEVRACLTNVCGTEKIAGCCVSDADCGVESACGVGHCVLEHCYIATIPSCCGLEGVCDDGNPCTTDSCADGVCSHAPVPTCCVSDEACADTKSCTGDRCIDNVCHNDPYPGCCETTSDCAAELVCAVAECTNHACVYLGTGINCCLQESDCGPGDACTTVSCSAMNECVFAPLATCCLNDGQCVDGNPCTTYRCESNACVHGAKPGAAPACSVVTFGAIGDIPYYPAEEDILKDWIAKENLLLPRLPFMIHLGDIKSGFIACTEDIYANVSSIMTSLLTPFYIVPGDNEWNDCNPSDAAWVLWTKYFMNFEDLWPIHPATTHSAVRPENFVFTIGPTIFVGINLVGGFVQDKDEWALRMTQNAEWIDAQLVAHPDYPTVVVMAQGEPSSNTEPFFVLLRARAAAWGKPFLYLHGDGHHFENDVPWPEVPNLRRIMVAADGAKPLHITVDPTAVDVFAVDEEPF